MGDADREGVWPGRGGVVPDPRDARGTRFPLAGVLAVTICAVLAGARSFTAIGEWVSELDTAQRRRIGLAKSSAAFRVSAAGGRAAGHDRPRESSRMVSWAALGRIDAVDDPPEVST